MTNKNRQCTYCKEYLERIKGVLCPAGWFCSIKHARNYVRATQNKQRQQQIKKAKQSQVKRDKASKKAARELKKNNRKYQFQLTKSVIQKWVNHVRDAGKPCISCGRDKPTIQYCGGHYKTAGGFPELALNTLNINKQCNRYCNHELSGNISGNKHSEGYTIGLIRRHGQERVDLLNSKHESPRYDCEQLIKIRAFYSKLIRDNNPDDSNRPY